MKFKTGILAALAFVIGMPDSSQLFAQTLSLEEIVVTARKRDENIYEIPVSVSAVSGDFLDKAGINTPDELSDYVPGLQFEGTTATGGRYNPSLRFRGMIQQIITPSTQTGALFWDGSFIGAGGGFLPLGDLERVEVIKGPQTAYFGRNTFTGAVNYIPAMPGDEWEGRVSFDMSPSQATELNIQGAVGGPLSDKVGIRAWVGHSKDGGDFDYDDGEPFGQMWVTTVTGTVAYDNLENLRVKVNGYYADGHDSGTAGGVDARRAGTAGGACNLVYTGEYINSATGERTPFTRDLSQFPAATFCGKYPTGELMEFPITQTPQGDFPFGQAFIRSAGMLNNVHPFMDKYDMIKDCGGKLCGEQRASRIQLKADYDVGDHTLSFLASAAATGTHAVVDFWFGVQSIPNTVFLASLELYNRERFYEARITSPQDQRLRYMLGVSDYTLRYRQARAPDRPGVLDDIDFQDNTTTALFAAVDYDIQDNLTLSVEARYTDEKSQNIVQGNPNLPCGLGTPTCGDVNEYDDFIPRVILSYEPFDGVTTYASYSYSSLLGIQTQAAFISSIAPEIIPPDQVDNIGLYTKPQENEQWEIGWKQVTDQYAFTLALFDASWDNQPLAAVVLLPGGGTSAFRNAGNSNYTGFDFEFATAPTEWLDLTGSVAYTYARMTQFSSRGSNEFIVLGSGGLSVVNDGNKPRNNPAWTVSFSPTITGALGDRDWFIRNDFLWHSATWADYSEFNRSPDYFRWNIRAGVNVTETVALELWGKNLTYNKTLRLSGGTTSGPGGGRKAFNTPIQKREFGVKLIANF